jgi:hypothetical protein
MLSKFEDHYIHWRESRMNGIKKYIKDGFLKNKSLLELGCGYADIGNEFYKLGCDVMSSDAREEYISVVRSKYPHIKTCVIDCDNTLLNQKFDIIVNWSLICHIKNIDQHIQNVSENCDYLFLETEVLDHECNTCIFTVEHGYDQAFNKNGNKSSQSKIEQILDINNFNYKIINDNILNSSFHKYNWSISNSSKYNTGQRRFWICWKKNKECPIKYEYIQVKVVSENDEFDQNYNYQEFDKIIFIKRNYIAIDFIHDYNPILSDFIDPFYIKIFNKKGFDQDVSIVIQGKLDLEILLKNIINALKYGNVILSVWGTHSLNKNHQNQVINFIKTYDIKGNNTYMQVYTSLLGIYQSKTNYTIKMRGDEYYSKLDTFIEKMRNDHTKIITSNIFFRKIKDWVYHISDHIIGGKTSNLFKMFSSCKCILEEKKNIILEEKKNIKQKDIAPEQWLTVSYLLTFYDESTLYKKENAKDLMLKHFDMIRVEEFADFIISCFGGKIYGKDDLIKRHNIRKRIIDIVNIHDI